MQIVLHQTHHKVADFKTIKSYLLDLINKKATGLHLFPELFLTGYPLQDLCLQHAFISRYEELLADLNRQSLTFKNDKNSPTFLMGGLQYQMSEQGLPLKIYNVIYQLTLGKPLNCLYQKRLLPNYDIFDEKKYFTSGDEPVIWNWNEYNIALLICEDMWPSTEGGCDPIEDLKQLSIQQNLNIDLVVNLSASPYHLGKPGKRLEQASSISNQLGAPFVYVNRVGGEDEILFDGGSFVYGKDQVLVEGSQFHADTICWSLPDVNSSNYEDGARLIQKGHSWEDLFNPRMVIKGNRIEGMKPVTDEECHQIIKALNFGLNEYVERTGFSNLLVAVSGGIDSALVLALLALGKTDKQNINALYLPSKYSSDLSGRLVSELCENLEIPLKTIPIDLHHGQVAESFMRGIGRPLEGLADENTQSRLRGMLLYAYANSINALVVNTSNKSELAVGYSTLYGDSVGAISLLGDLYKSEVYRLADYINNNFENIIPGEIITRPPTAELREGQLDTDSLPPYDTLDAILEGILSYRFSFNKFLEMGFAPEDVRRVFGLYHRSEYKRFQFCPIIKLKAKSFGFGYRIPLCKNQFELEDIYND